MLDWKTYKVPFIGEGRLGRLAVEKFTVSAEHETIGRMRAIFNPHRVARFATEGSYTRLVDGPSTSNTRTSDFGTLWMSDTRDEILDHSWLLSAHGRVLVHGLGLGVALNMLMLNPKVTAIDVIEISSDVVNLVLPSFEGREGFEKVNVRVEDALTYKTERGARWDFAWHDIWPDICGGNWDSMKRMHRRFARRVEVAQNSWSRDMVRQLK